MVGLRWQPHPCLLLAGTMTASKGPSLMWELPQSRWEQRQASPRTQSQSLPRAHGS